MTGVEQALVVTGDPGTHVLIGSWQVRAGGWGVMVAVSDACHEMW